MERQETRMDYLPLSVSISTQVDYVDVRSGSIGVTMPTLRETTATFTALIDGEVVEYTFKAVGPVTLSHRPGELSEDDRLRLRKTRRMINDLLDE